MTAAWEAISHCWNRHPGLLYGLASATGACLALSLLPPVFLAAVACLLMLPLVFLPKHRRHFALRFSLAAVLCAATYSFTKAHYRLPETPQQISQEGHAYFTVTSITSSKIPFQKALSYQGILQRFVAEDGTGGAELAANIPISLFVPMHDHLDARPDASYRYQLHARLKHLGDGRYSLSPVKNAQWVPISKEWNLVEWRFAAKTWLSQYIQRHIQDPHVAAFLTGIATGEFNDRLLTFELARFGLQHLMAISGLHFAIMASILGFGLRLFFPTRISAALLIAALSGYFLFLGNSPSVIRAWMAIVIGLSALLVERQSSALNSLGLALLFTAFWDPFSMRQIGFQFSYAVTASILLWFPACDLLLQRIFAKRSLSQAVSMGWLDRHGYCLLFFFRQALALGLAVNIAALPLTLFYFQKFPLLSLVYNLFFPFMISISMLLLLLGMAATLLLPAFGSYVHALNEAYTHFVLNFTFKLPKAFDSTLYAPPFPFEALLVYLVFTFVLGIAVTGRTKQKNFAY